ncbi:MAG: hypothetical protein KJ706_08205 [Candidatus Omnitrophica bacterium]|nr:hypothetical protein [Candidatus Omnitrophota bacterium]MBU4589939.1 hypothetical protein [Candidatus Omnitrophota bacterium]
MVGIRFFLIFILCFLLFGASAYGLRPLEDIGETGKEDALSPEIEEEIAEIEREKEALMKDVSPLREERENTLRPFVYESAPLDVESPRPVKNIVSPTVEKTPTQAENLTSKPLPNLIFFSLIVIAFFSAYFFLRPKP